MGGGGWGWVGARGSGWEWVGVGGAWGSVGGGVGALLLLQQMMEPKISVQNESSRISIPALTVVELSTLDITIQIVCPNSSWLAISGSRKYIPCVFQPRPAAGPPCAI